MCVGCFEYFLWEHFNSGVFEPEFYFPWFSVEMFDRDRNLWREPGLIPGSRTPEFSPYLAFRDSVHTCNNWFITDYNTAVIR